MKALLILILLMPVIKVTQAQERNKSITAIDLNGKKLTLQKVSLATYKAMLSKPYNRRIKDTSIIKRSGVLKFKLSNGKEVSFKDITKHEAENKTYSFKGVLNNRFYVVLGKYYDTGEYLLIDKFNGDVTSLWGEPNIAPDGMHLASFSSALGYDMMPNGIQMFRISNNKLVPDWEYKIEDWEPEAIRWNDNSSLLVSKYISADLSKTNREVKEYIKLSFTD